MQVVLNAGALEKGKLGLREAWTMSSSGKVLAANWFLSRPTHNRSRPYQGLPTTKKTDPLY